VEVVAAAVDRLSPVTSKINRGAIDLLGSLVAVGRSDVGGVE
jgi:hypothetical protein